MKKNFLSFIIPAKDEEDNILLLYEELGSIIKKIGYSAEIIFIDDGSTDKTFERLKKLSAHKKEVKVIRFRGNFGKSMALQAGFDISKGDIIFTLDADLQDNPKEIPKFLEKIESGFDLVSGWKEKRYDPWDKVLPSRIINFLARVLTGVKIHDTNCGFKAYRREVVDSLNLYGELYRFIPIFAAKQNFKVGEVEVEHRPRRFGKTKFGWGRGIKGMLDLITVIFLTVFFKRPAHFFGSLGLISFSTGFIIGIYISYLRVSTGSIQNRHPLLFLGMLLMIIGIQLFSTGLLAEMIIYNSSRTRISSSAYSKEKSNLKKLFKEISG